MNERIVKDHETIQQRKRLAVAAMAEVAKWEHCTHDVSRTNDFNHEIESQWRMGQVPPYVWDEEREEPKSYAWQVFCTTLSDTVGRKPQDILRMKAEAERTLRQGRGKPTATDGSQGQWRAYHLIRIVTFDWVLHGESE